MGRVGAIPGFSALKRVFRSWFPLALANCRCGLPVLGAEPLFADSTDELTTFFGNLSKAAALGDIDGDGDLDAVVAQGGFSSGEANAIWLNDGAGAFTLAEVTLGLGDTSDVALADSDGDGDLDIWFANQTVDADARDAIWLNPGGRQGGDPR